MKSEPHLPKCYPAPRRFVAWASSRMVPGLTNNATSNSNLSQRPMPRGLIMRTVDALVPAGKTPLTSGVEVAAEALDYREKPGVIVVVTDGEETCGRLPCELAKQLKATAMQLTVHVIGFRYENYSWTGGNSVMELMCLADQNNGLYIKANSEGELVEALEKTLDCPMISQAPGQTRRASLPAGSTPR